MASYRVEWKASAVKDLRKLPQESVARILAAVEALKEDPFPHGSKKLVGSRSSYRIREGVYRVLYTVAQELLIIEIVKVGHRKDVYDK
jgi:mRNA interferase RelE/StbE